MALPKGITAQPSRFAALNLDSESESDGSGDEWLVVSGNKGTNKTKSNVGAPAQQKDDPAGARPLSKSAKKRARKKRNQQNLSESKDSREEQAGDEVSGEGENPELKQWQVKEEEKADLKFHKELEEALLQSKLTAEQEKEIEKQRKAAAALKKQAKKGVKITLQMLHRGGDTTSEPEVQSPKVHEVVNDSAFFEQLGYEVESEIRKAPERRISESLMSPAEESARVAHVMDELEKRDKTIAALRKENDALKCKMKEVKERNQQLCKILGQGEFLTKTQLLEQIEQLTTLKNELTAEVERLHSLLEQERSRNKTIQTELTKHVSKMGKTRHHS